MRRHHDISISFDTDNGDGNIAIVKEADDRKTLTFRYKQHGGTMYHNHPIPMQEGPDAIRSALHDALSQPSVWGANPTEEWMLTLIRAAETVWGIDRRLT